MRIEEIFKNSITRNINGVVKVGDTDNEDLIYQELTEYVVARELQGHFATFYSNYEKSIDVPTSKMGAWISGFFGSGKSHFLKMLSYVLANREVKGKRAVDYFQDKIADPMVFAQMKRCASIPTETILFNVDSKGGKWKEGDTAKTALLRSFERVFYESRGFYGEDLKLAKLEEFIDSKGKTEEFRSAFETNSGMEWLENRESYAFYEDDVIETLVQVLGMSREAAQHWFDGAIDDVISSETFAMQVKDYVDAKIAEFGDFRLLFMADEVGQFMGTDSNLILSMQTLVEDLGTTCEGKVWVVVTSQAAIDSVTDIVGMDFSKIQGRFDTRLSLSSSDVDEIIKERILAKTDEATSYLEAEYKEQATVLKNLFSFDDSTSDLFGYSSPKDFVQSYPFVSYQFKILPSVFTKTREHGFSGKHLSSGERSMLSAFKESAEKVKDEGMGVLVPFWRFYDTIETSLDYGIRQVIDRCQKAANEGHGLQQIDVEVIKTLYLIRYIGDITASVNNIANLMIDRMDVDKIALREKVKGSLERLCRENKAARNGDKYNFLTSEEQDIADEISRVDIDSADVVDKIKVLLFNKIYTDSKHRRGSNDFPFDRYVDDSVHGRDLGGMKLNVITYAHEYSRLSEAEFALRSVNQALVGLAEGDYYELLDMTCRIDKFVRTNPVTQWPKVRQDIVRDKQNEARENEKLARTALEDAIMKGRFAVNGRPVNPAAPNAAKKIDAVLDELVESVYTKAGYVDSPVNNDADIIAILKGTKFQEPLPGEPEANQKAMDEVGVYLDAQAWSHQSTSMGDIQRKYQKAPYGWREIDVAAVVAQLISRQKASMSVAGKQLGKDDLRDIASKLRKDFDGATIKKREELDQKIVVAVQKILKEFTGSSLVPGDEDGLVSYAKEQLSNALDACKELQAKWYSRYDYPGKDSIREGKNDLEGLLANAVDPVIFLKSLSTRESESILLDLSEDMEKITGFFNSQVRLYDEAKNTLSEMITEGVYIEGNGSAQNALEELSTILSMSEPYSRIKDIQANIDIVEEELKSTASAKRDNLLGAIEDALDQIKRYADEEKVGFESVVDKVVSNAEMAAIAKRDAAHSTKLCSQLDAQLQQLSIWIDQQINKIDEAIQAEKLRRQNKTPEAAASTSAPQKQSIAKLKRSRVCPTKTLRTSKEVDEYVEKIRTDLLKALETNDAVRLEN